GDIEGAGTFVRRFAGMFRDVPLDAEWLPLAAIFAEALWLVGDEPSAADAYEMLLPYRHRYAIEGIGACAYGSIAHYLGLLARTVGREDDAVTHFEAALRANVSLSAPLITARNKRELA